MVQVHHISFKKWNPIGKPRKKAHGNSGVPPGSVKDGVLINKMIAKSNAQTLFIIF